MLFITFSVSVPCGLFICSFPEFFFFKSIELPNTNLAHITRVLYLYYQMVLIMAKMKKVAGSSNQWPRAFRLDIRPRLTLS